jgi:L-alanine-DL-glutamate epimerase-like enolase superfamily enzyme
MRIDSLETIPYGLPFREPYVTARGTLERREMILLRLRTSGGPVGLGEAVALTLRGGPDLTSIERELREGCAPLLEGQKVTLATLSGLIAGIAAAGASRPALSAVDLALHDLVGKVEGDPVWQLLGAGACEPVRCNATLVVAEPASVADEAERWMQDGFETFKLKVGVPEDVAQVRAVRDRAGGGARIRVDANAAWSPAQAIERLDAMASVGLELAEQPTADLAGMVEVRRACRTPLAADESVADADEASLAVEQGACDLATIKLAKVGGIAAALDVAARIPAYLSSALDGPLGIAAAAHLAQVMPAPGIASGLAQGLATQRLFSATIAARGPELDGPLLLLPDEPGLGVEIDELALARHRLDR